MFVNYQELKMSIIVLTMTQVMAKENYFVVPIRFSNYSHVIKWLFTKVIWLHKELVSPLITIIELYQ